VPCELGQLTEENKLITKREQCPGVALLIVKEELCPHSWDGHSRSQGSLLEGDEVVPRQGDVWVAPIAAMQSKHCRIRVQFALRVDSLEVIVDRVHSEVIRSY